MKQQHDVRDVVLLHGWGLGACVWNGLAARLAARYRVHARDLPGYGARPSWPADTLESLAAESAAAAPARCLVVGWSLGGMVALEWAAGAPRQVERLALVATTPCFVQRRGWPHAVPARVLEDFSRTLATDRAATLGRFLLLLARGDTRAKRVARELRAALPARSAPGSETLARGLDILRQADLRGRLAMVRQPALVLHGERDALVPLAAGERLGRALPNGRFAVLKGAAHAPFVSRPDEMCAMLADFFDER